MRDYWVKAKIENMLSYIQPTKYIVDNTDYNDQYETPVLTAGKSFIIGYTNEKNNIFLDIPVIIFDDFTTATQYVNFEFKVKSSAMKILSPTSMLVNLKYIYFYLKTIRCNTDTHKRYWISTFSKLPIKIAPLPEQRAIVDKIEMLFSELDNGIANLRAAKDKLEIYRQAVLKKAFEGELTKEWRKNNITNAVWTVAPIKELVQELTQGWSPRCINQQSLNSDEWAVIKTSAIQSGKFLPEENKILPKDLEPKHQHEIHEGDILITRAGPRVRVGVCCLVRKIRPRLLNCDKAYRLKLSNKINKDYFEYKMNSLELIHEIEKIKTGGNDSGLNLTQSRFLSITISLPSIQEQDQIVQEIETRFSVCDNIQANIEEDLKKAEALRQSILKKAFEGKLLSKEELEACRNEPDWEPADKLLERINKSKEKEA